MLVVFDDLPVNPHGWEQGDYWGVMLLGLWQCEAQIGILASHHFHMPVLERLQVARTDEAVDHEPHCPCHVWGHAIVAVDQFVAFTQGTLTVWMGLASQAASSAKDSPVFSRCECAA